MHRTARRVIAATVIACSAALAACGDVPAAAARQPSPTSSVEASTGQWLADAVTATGTVRHVTDWALVNYVHAWNVKHGADYAAALYAAQVAAAARARPAVATSSGGGGGGGGEGHWLRIGRCEQPGNGYGGINWSADGYTAHGHFQGGLGISTDAWRENSAGMPSSALAASPQQQMIVAQRIYDRFGPSAWGCK